MTPCSPVEAFFLYVFVGGYILQRFAQLDYRVPNGKMIMHDESEETGRGLIEVL